MNSNPPWQRSSKDAAGQKLPAEHFILAPPTPRGEIIGIVGAGGKGKTLLACLIERACGPVGFVDLDGSLPVLKAQLDELGLSPQAVSGIDSWARLIGALKSPVFDAMKNIVIDTATEAQNLGIAHVPTVYKNDKGENVDNIEGYGFQKGYRYLHDTWLDLRTCAKDHAAAGRNVILIMHDCIAKVPNPSGPDFVRYEPALFQNNEISLRRTTRDFLDHMLYIGSPVNVVAADPKRGIKHGKATGGDARVIYFNDTGTHMAKSRRFSGEMEYEYGSDALWQALFNTETQKEN